MRIKRERGERRVARVERSGTTPTDYFSYDIFGNVAAESNSVASVAHSRDNLGMDTNEVTTVGAESLSLERAYDDCRRLTVMRRGGATAYAYAADGKLASISNADAFVEYAYAPDRRGLGYALTLPNGGAFRRELARHRYIRSDIERVVNSFNGIAVSDLSYTNDALGRPVSRNSDAFAYNNRGELASARISGGLASYCYDSIGNVTTSATASSATEFAADSRNAYSQILKDGTPVSVARDLDGNLANYGCWTYSHDSASRMTSAMSNGVTVASMSYDALGRRVMKSTQSGTRIYFYDCNLLVREVYLRNDGTRSVTDYFWGADISGEIGEAAGIGGLLYVKRDGEVYIPFCDAYGNVLGYVDVDGEVVASYAYDAFGGIISQSGTLADAFAHRFSTKYFDTETGLYYYGYRFYSPELMRWLSRDPIEESGGLNLYAFCRNNAVSSYDVNGLISFCDCVEVKSEEIRYKKVFYKYAGWPFGWNSPKNQQTYSIDIKGRSEAAAKKNCDWAYAYELRIVPSGGENMLVDANAPGNAKGEKCRLFEEILDGPSSGRGIRPPMRYYPVVKLEFGGKSNFRKYSLWDVHYNVEGRSGYNTLAQILITSPSPGDKIKVWVEVWNSGYGEDYPDVPEMLPGYDERTIELR